MIIKMSCDGCHAIEARQCKGVIRPNARHLNLKTVSGLQDYLQSEEKDYQKLHAAFIQSTLWNSPRTITIGFLALNTSESLNPSSWAWKRAWISYLVKTYIEPLVNLTFTINMNPAQGSTCDIRILFDTSSGCYSRYGIDALQNWGGYNESMNFGWMDAPLNHTFTFQGVSYTTPMIFDQGGYPGQGTTILHEFGHALGMVHEHNTPFQLPFTWNTAAVYQYFEGPPNNWTKEDVDNNVLFSFDPTGMNGSNFDPNSIMKYSFSGSFLLNPTPTLIQQIQRLNLVLSNCDKYWLIQNYPGRVAANLIQTLGAQCTSDTSVNAIPTSPPTPAPTTPSPTPRTTPSVTPSGTPSVTPAPTTPFGGPTPSPAPKTDGLVWILLLIALIAVGWYLWNKYRKTN